MMGKSDRECVLHDLHQALTELGKLRFGEMRVEDAMHEIVQTTHAIFDVDGAGLMLADAEHRLGSVPVSDDRLGHHDAAAVVLTGDDARLPVTVRGAGPGD
jgi:hypothetical protein